MCDAGFYLMIYILICIKKYYFPPILLKNFIRNVHCILTNDFLAPVVIIISAIDFLMNYYKDAPRVSYYWISQMSFIWFHQLV